MAQSEWTAIFSNEARNLKHGDSWRLEFDDSLEPDSPNPGWKQYIRNTGARFTCRTCGRGWPSNRVMVIFHMYLMNGQGIVKVRRFRQNCKMCTAAPMENPSITADNLKILLENLVKKIRIKCYHEDLGTKYRSSVPLDVKSPHEPNHCEGCMRGICNRS